MSLFVVSKHIVGVVFHDRVLHVHVVIVRQLGYFGVRWYCPRSCGLLCHIVEVGFIRSFIVVVLLYGSLVQLNQMFRGSALSSKVVWTTTFMTCKCLAFAFAFAFPLIFGSILLIFAVVFALLEFTKFLLMVVRPITFFITLHIIVNL
jgi:hypothetical protein